MLVGIAAAQESAPPPAATPDAAPLPVIPVPEQQEPAPAQDESDKTAVKLDEVIVTSTKRAKSAREIPASVDAFHGDDLNQRGAQGAQDALPDSPGVSANSYISPNFTNIDIRGTTVDTVTTTGGPPTGAFFDDVPLTSPTFLGSNPNIDAFDLATVEVLKGPQGTLFGGSALAGALRATPNAPELSKFGGEGFYSRANISQSDGAGNDYGVMLNVPIGDSFAIRGMGLRRRYPGVIDNLLDGTQDTDSNLIQTWRGLLRWEPFERLSLNGVFHETRGAVNDATITDNEDRLDRSNESGLSPSSWRYRIAQIKGEYRFDNFSVVTAGSGVRKTDSISLQADHVEEGQTPVFDVVSGPQLYTADIRTQELRIVSTQRTTGSWIFADWDWLIGLFNYRADQTAVAPITVTSRPLLPVLPPVSLEAVRADVVSLAKERALYFDVTRYLGSRWEINLGGRLFRQHMFGMSTTTGGMGNVNAGSNSGTRDAKGFNPKLALTWHLNKQLALRAAAVKGFRFGGVNVVIDHDPNAPLFYDTDQLWNYELGVRSDWLDRRLRFDVTGFYIDWSRTQISQRTFTGIGTFIDNVGSAVSKGVEAQARAFLPWGFSLNATGAYIDARTTADFQAEGGAIPSGTRLPGTPYMTGSASLGYGASIWRLLVDGGLSWNYQGRAFNTLSHAAVIPAYQLFNLHCGLSLPDVIGRPRLDLGVANLFDKRAYNGVLPPISGAQMATDYFPVRSRTITLRIDARF
jgi:outer membrane receptor protein involved in Fe transport